MSFFQKKEELPSVWHSFALWNERFEWMREAMPIEIPPKPDWLVQKPEDRLHEWYDRLPVVFENGRIVLGHIVQANERLFHRGYQDHPMKVIYTQDVFYYDNLEKWASFPYEIYERTQKEPVTEEITKLTAILEDELGREFAFPIPKSITGGRRVFLSTLVAIREHLPKKRLQDGILPLLVYREGKHPDALYLPKWYH